MPTFIGRVAGKKLSAAKIQTVENSHVDTWVCKSCSSIDGRHLTDKKTSKRNT